MNKQKVSVFIVWLVAIGVFSCKKQNENQPNTQVSKLPPITQTGAGTFGCLVNGNAVVSNTISCTFVQTTKLASNNYFSFTLTATDSTSANKQTIGVYIPGIMLFTNNTSFALNGPPNVPVRWYADYTNLANDGFVNYYQTTYPGFEADAISFSNPFVFSKIDTIKKIFSGTFSFNVINGNNEILPVTQGRFDVHYTVN